jgi:hypothetical protein
MAATIKIKNSSTASAVPTTGDLVQGELAVNVTDKKLFTKNSAGAIVELSTPAAGSITADKLSSTAQYTGFKNRIINGAMMIDQRNAGATLSLASTVTALYATDRFYAYQDKSGVTGTVSQSTDAPAGFKNSFAVTITTGSASASGDQSFIQQGIEGLNVADLGFGTASAQPVTISFWVKSSITGTNGFSISNSAGNRWYVGSYTINAANTWEYKTTTILGDTSGTWLTTNGMGIRLRFNIGSGSSFLGAAGSWGSSIYNGPTGSFSTTGTSGATLYITGVQLEKGSTATSFDYRPYGTELALCQRYYEQSSTYISGGIAGVTGSQIVQVFYKTTKRASATATLLGSVGGSVIQAGIDGFQITRTNDNPYATAGYSGAAEL